MPLFKRLTDRMDGRYWPEDIADAVRRRDMQLWVVLRGDELRGIILTQVVVWPRVKVCCLFGVAGYGVREWLHVREQLRQWGREQGCAVMEVSGRHGWQRLLPDYELSGSIYTRSV